MTEEATLILDIAEEKMNKALEHLVEALLGIRAGKASPNVLKGIMVDYYGSQTPVSQVASVTVPDAKTILIQPWEKGMIPVIEKAILVSNIGLTPSNNGEHIRLSIPALTEERRRELVKQVKGEGETARVSVRNAAGTDSVPAACHFGVGKRWLRVRISWSVAGRGRVMDFLSLSGIWQADPAGRTERNAHR